MPLADIMVIMHVREITIASKHAKPIRQSNTKRTTNRPIAKAADPAESGQKMSHECFSVGSTPVNYYGEAHLRLENQNIPGEL